MKALMLLACCGWLVATGASAQDARTEVPITQAKGVNGRYYYFIPVSVGGSAPFQTLLDSGSVGLRILPGLLRSSDAEPTARESVYGYGTGSQFTGVLGRASVSIGGLTPSKAAAIQLIAKVGCRQDRPSCPAANVPVAEFGFASEGGLPGPPQRARIGIDLDDADADNPLALLGNGQWIVELPRPGDSAPGRLILNPQPQDLAGFTRARLPNDGLPGCVSNSDTGLEICGLVLLDTGGNGMIVEARERPGSFPWPNGAHAVLTMGDARTGGVRMPFVVQHAPGDPNNLHWGRGNARQPRISGSAPFLAYSVLFDSRTRTIGFKSRN